MSVFIGTSGWYYEHWTPSFYPSDLKKNLRLSFYTKIFNTVEINSTFYHLPKKAAVHNWYSQVPDSFIFSIKVSGFLTHRKRLIDEEGEVLHRFLESIEELKDKKGPLLFQLPPSFKKNLSRLEQVLNHLPKKIRAVFEFREASWYDEEVYDLLKKYNVALCITDLKGHLSPKQLTANFTYIRLHGPKESAYKGSYSMQMLKEWKKQILAWKKEKIDTYCYFDNDEKGYAAQNALELITLLKG